MFCSHCGNQVPDGSKFCAHCGAQTQAAAPQTAPRQPYTPPQQTQPIYTAPQQPIAATAPKTEKKKTPIWVSIAIGLAAFGIAYFIIAPAISGGNNKPDDGSLQNNNISNNAGSYQENDNNYGADTESTEGKASLTIPDTASSEYNEIFSGHNIVTSPAFLRSSKTAAFAYIDSTGMIEKMEFGYEGDIIHEFIDTIYIPLSGTGQTAQELETSLRNTFGSYESLSFCTVSYSAGTQYYTVTISLKDLDEAENVQLVGDLIDISGDGLISFSQTERSLLTRGFVKR